jgi:hypothetical protein
MLKQIVCFVFLLLSVINQLTAQETHGKWGFSASVSPWMDNREFSMSRTLTNSWSILFWADFTNDSNDNTYRMEGYKWIAGPELRRKLFFLKDYNIAPYAGIMVNGGYETWHNDARKYNVKEGGIELTFGVEYFINSYLSLYIHTRFFQYHYSYIDLDAGEKYLTGYHVVKAFSNPPSLYIRFYF